MRLHALFGAALLLMACGPSVGEARLAIRPAKPEGCPLELVPQVRAEDMAPGARFGSGGELEMIGTVMIGAEIGTDAMSEEIRSLVRPRACAMGGEVISLLASGSSPNGLGGGTQGITFTVWAKRAAAPSTPQPF